MKKINKKGFTLIELLVVITIIAILATVWVNQFWKSLQKARDSKRTSDILSIKTAITQAFTDEQEYPSTKATSFRNSVSPYIDVLPKDEKHLQPWNKSWYPTWKEPALWYVYISWPDSTGILGATYEISTAFEASSNIKNVAKKDQWNDNNRKEIWNVTMNMNTSLLLASDFKTNCTADNSTDWKAILIGWDKLCDVSNWQYTD